MSRASLDGHDSKADDRMFDDGTTTSFLAVETWLRGRGVNVAGLRLPKQGGWVVVDGDTFPLEAK